LLQPAGGFERYLKVIFRADVHGRAAVDEMLPAALFRQRHRRVADADVPVGLPLHRHAGGRSLQTHRCLTPPLLQIAEALYVVVRTGEPLSPRPQLLLLGSEVVVAIGDPLQLVLRPQDLQVRLQEALALLLAVSLLLGLEDPDVRQRSARC
jgi:hypothetical protein